MHTVQLNVTIQGSHTTSIYLDIEPSRFSQASYFARFFSDGLLVPAVGVENAVWYPPHRIAKVELMGSAPEKPRSDRHEDY
jgi:hypothetical protein